MLAASLKRNDSADEFFELTDLTENISQNAENANAMSQVDESLSNVCTFTENLGGNMRVATQATAGLGLEFEAFLTEFKSISK